MSKARITDERLAELAELYAKEAEDAKPWVGEASVEAHVNSALLELQELRTKHRETTECPAST